MRQESAKTGSKPRIERVEFGSRRGVRLVGLWHVGTGDASVILCHGMESSKSGVKAVRLATDLSAAGCNVLRFDVLYEGADHRFSDPVLLDQLLGDIAAWMIEKICVEGGAFGGGDGHG